MSAIPAPSASNTSLPAAAAAASAGADAAASAATGAATAAAAAPAPRLPELLAPAGDWDCVRAAVENGADAIYFGLDRFNARMRAKNFTLDGLPGLMAFLHRRGVRGYVTFNTLVFTGELAAAADFARAIIAAGADAAIVQDAGICRLIRRLSPDFPIHASTQMTVTSAAGVEFARGLGAHLVVLARENTLADINAIQEAQRASGAPPLPLEVFVHGALCVAYSGQCLTSESLGGRSANRGECAQACRLPYELVCDGRKVDLGDRRYLLSPRDLAGLDVLPDLVRAGVASLKIEGRLKSPEYVASITRVYRRALDEIFLSTAAAVSAQPGATRLKPDCVAPDAATGAATGALPGAAHAPAPAAAAVRYELEMSFSRGLHTGWFRGIDNRLLVHARFGTKRGVFLGEILGVRHESVTLRPAAPLKPGDGVVFDAGDPGQREEGGRIYEMDTARDGGATLRFGRGDIDFRRVRPGQLLWKTNDPALDRELRATYEGGKIRRASPVSLEVRGHAGAPLTLIARDTEGRAVRVDSATPLAPAQTRPLTAAGLRDQFARLGGTPFRLGALATHLEGGVMLPVSELNRLRREAIAGLDALRAQPRRWTLHETDDDTAAGAVAPPAPGSARVPRADEGRPRPSQKNPAQTADGGTPPVSPRDAGAPQSAATVPATAGAGTTATIAAPAAAAAPSPEIIPVLRDPGQLEAALAVPGLATFYCEFENPKHYRDAVARFRAWQSTPPAAPQTSIWVAPPRITKPGEEWILRQVRSCEADGYLVRNPDHLAFFAADRKRGDFSLNIANPPAAGYFLARHGLERVTASYDLNLAQLEALLSAAPPAWFDLTIHQRMPMFHMEHCVFCAFLSAGKKDYRDCGRPCEKHEVRLRDRTGAEFPLKADAGCRNTVFNNRAQTGAESVARLLALGARFFRVEFVNETPAEVAHTLRRYQQLLRGEITGPALWRELRLLNQLGVTRGQMER